MNRRLMAALTLVLAWGCAPPPPPAPTVPLLDDLGAHEYTVSTRVPTAQQ